jgi:hypothetical protein
MGVDVESGPTVGRGTSVVHRHDRRDVSTSMPTVLGESRPG